MPKITVWSTHMLQQTHIHINTCVYTHINCYLAEADLMNHTAFLLDQFIKLPLFQCNVSAAEMSLK